MILEPLHIMCDGSNLPHGKLWLENYLKKI